MFVHKSYRSRSTYVVSDSSAGSVFVYGAGGWGSIPNELIFSHTMSTMTLEAVTFCLLLKRLHFLVFFLPLLTFENEKSAVRF
jgi:hypothetical protein